MISPKAVSFIIAQEDGSESYYDRTEEHFDWPGGASGPTVAIGYDLGYVTVNECIQDWTGIVDAVTINEMILGVGLTGERAHIFVEQNHDAVTITWHEAIQEFTEREIPKWEHRMAAALPNWDLLNSTCRGALLSLGYNRGTGGFNSSLPRYSEMSNIRIAMLNQRFELIPGEIKSMVRIWPNVPSLQRRRILEAQLFAEGLSLPAEKPIPIFPPAPPPPPTPAKAGPTGALPMGDTITEIETVVSEVSKFLPTIAGIVGAFVPGAGGLLTMASPFLAITNEILSAIETLKSGGMSHQSAAAVVGAVVTHIGQTIAAAMPVAPAASALAPLAPAPGSAQAPTSIPAPHETH